ncbi:MAG: hypothetical protein AAGK97_06085, partial [Bacteroidota bacterium]
MSIHINPGHSNYVKPEYYHAMKEWVEGPTFILHAGDLPTTEVNDFVKMYESEASILSADAKAQFQLLNLESFAFLISNANFDRSKNYILDCEGKSWSETLQTLTIEESVLIEILKEFPIFIDFKFNIEDFKKLLASDIYGICIQGGEEEAVGVKLFDDLDILFETIEAYQN